MKGRAKQASGSCDRTCQGVAKVALRVELVSLSADWHTSDDPEDILIPILKAATLRGVLLREGGDR